MQEVQWLTAKEVLRVNASKWPNKIGAKDLYKEFTFKQWNERSCRLANALADYGYEEGRPLCRPRIQLLSSGWISMLPPQREALSSSPSCSASQPRRWSTTSITVNARSSSSRAVR